MTRSNVSQVGLQHSEYSGASKPVRRGVAREVGAALAVACAAIVSLSISGCSNVASGPTHIATETAPRYTLLHHRSDSTATAVTRGVLGIDRRGCVTLGGSVLVMGPGSTVDDEGSLIIQGRRFKQGERLSLVGGFGDAPKGSRCEAGARYWWG